MNEHGDLRLTLLLAAVPGLVIWVLVIRWVAGAM